MRQFLITRYAVYPKSVFGCDCNAKDPFYGLTIPWGLCGIAPITHSGLVLPFPLCTGRSRKCTSCRAPMAQLRKISLWKKQTSVRVFHTVRSVPEAIGIRRTCGQKRLRTHPQVFRQILAFLLCHHQFAPRTADLCVIFSEKFFLPIAKK